jgi:hypothetical protein
MVNFKSGDRVVCVNTCGHGGKLLVLGNEYVVDRSYVVDDRSGAEMVHTKEFNGTGFYSYRFALKEEPTNSFKPGDVVVCDKKNKYMTADEAKAMTDNANGAAMRDTMIDIMSIITDAAKKGNADVSFDIPKDRCYLIDHIIVELEALKYAVEIDGLNLNIDWS